MPKVPTETEIMIAFFILYNGSFTPYSSFGVKENESAIICKCPYFLKIVTGSETFNMFPPFKIFDPMEAKMCLNIFLCSDNSFSFVQMSPPLLLLSH